MALTDRERQQVRDLLRTVPLSFKWTQGTRLPEVNTKELVFFENEELESMRVGVRRGQKTYWLFTGTIADDDDQDAVGNINLLRHAKRHATSTYDTVEDLQTNTDPITPYKFTWTGAHTWTPGAVDRVPITINAATGQTANLLVINDKNAESALVVNPVAQHAIGAAAQTAMLNVKAVGSSWTPDEYSSLEAWYDGSLETGGHGSAVNTMTDRSGNGHSMTGGGTTPPVVYANWQNSLNAVSSSKDSAGYFRQDTPFDLTDSFTIVWIGKNTRATARPMFFSTTAVYTGVAYNVPTWTRNSLNSSPPDPWTTPTPTWAEPGNNSFAGSAISNWWLAPIGDSHAGNKYVHAMVVTRTSPTDWQVTEYNFNGIDKTGAAGTTTLIPDNDKFVVDYVLTYPQEWGEMCLFNTALSSAQVEQVENYLATKWQFLSEGVQDTELEFLTTATDIFSGEDSSGDRRVHIDDTGNVGLDGAATVALDPNVRLHVRDDETTPQVIIDYDTSNQLQIAVASDGDAALTATTDMTLTATGGDLILIPAVNSDIVLHSDSGALVYVLDDRVGIGVAAPATPFHLINTNGGQFRIGYDATYYMNINVASDGDTNIASVGDLELQSVTDIICFGNSDSDTKTFKFRHTTADGTLTYGGTSWKFDQTVEIETTGTQLLLSYDATKGTYIQTLSSGQTRFYNTSSNIFKFGETAHIAAPLAGLNIENGGLTINRESASPYMRWSENGVDLFQIRSDSNYILFTDGSSTLDLLKIRHNTTPTSGEAAVDIRDQNTTSQEGLRIRKGINANNKHILFSYNNGVNYTHAISTGHNSGGKVNNTINFHLWDNTIGGNTALPGASEQHLTIAHDNLIIGPSNTDDKTLTFNDSGGDGTITYDGSTFTFSPGSLALESLTFTEVAAPSTPSANDSVIYLDSTIEELVTKKDTGDVHNLERSMNLVSSYIDVKSRNQVLNLNGSFTNVVTAGAVSSGSPQAATCGIGKLVIVVNAGADTAGTLTVTGTQVDRNTGAETGAYADNLTIAGTSTDTTTTDAAGNNVWGFTNAYITSVWFTGAVSISSADLNLSDIDVYQIAFEQFNDELDTTLETQDITGYATNTNAWYYGHTYKITVSSGTCTIASLVDIAWPASKVAANTSYRWRRTIDENVDGTTDGVWTEHYFGPLASAYWENINFKLWFSQPKKE